MTTKRAEPGIKRQADYRETDDSKTTISAIRKRNLLWLREKFEQTWLQENPDSGTWGMDARFAEHIGVNPKYFSFIKSERRNVGSVIAREVERVFSLPEGWMDSAHDDAADSTSEENEMVAALLMVYRADPEAARIALLRLIQEHLGRKMGTNKKKGKT